LEAPATLTLYPGYYPDSEDRVLSLKDYKATLKKVGIDVTALEIYLHSCGQWINFPWNCTIPIFTPEQPVESLISKIGQGFLPIWVSSTSEI
jgi:hypothetical protein